MGLLVKLDQNQVGLSLHNKPNLNGYNLNNLERQIVSSLRLRSCLSISTVLICPFCSSSSCRVTKLQRHEAKLLHFSLVRLVSSLTLFPPSFSALPYLHSNLGVFFTLFWFLLRFQIFLNCKLLGMVKFLLFFSSRL